MREQPRWRRYLRFWGPDIAADVDEELRFHLDMRERDFLAAGLSPAVAREEALARFGDPEQVARWLRDHDTRKLRRSRRTQAMSDLLQDVRYGLRRLWKSPGFTLAVVTVLALGIGATTAIFSVIDAALLRPLPYPEPGRLVAVYGPGQNPFSFPQYADWKRDTKVFADLGVYWRTTYTLTGEGEPELLQFGRMSANVPRMLGVVPRVGRLFTPAEDLPGSEGVIMLSEALWRRRFGGDPGILGKTLTLGEEPYTVIGIIPPGRRSTVPTALAAAQELDAWMSLRLSEKNAPRTLQFLDVLGRLRPGLDLGQAEEQTASFARGLKEAQGTDQDVSLLPLERLVIGNARPLLIALAGAVAMVLLIACTNVANLLLARAAVRRREIAVRAALGAARGRLVRQLLAESLLLALVGGAAGVLVAWAGVVGLRAVGPGSVPRLAETTVDAKILGFALILSLGTGLLFGLLPALRASRADLGEVMKEGARGTAGGPARERLRGTLIVAEVALSFALLIGAGLLLRSLERLLAVDKGFDAGHVITSYLLLPYSSYPEGHQQAAFFREVRERVQALPGVQTAALVSDIPLNGGSNGGVGIEGREYPPGKEPFAEKRIASPGYFEALRIPIRAGRVFNERDIAGGPAVVVVNQAFAQSYFPGESALGKRVDFRWDTNGMQEIVGVVADVREQALHQPARPTIYIPHAQRPTEWAYLLVRTTGDPNGIVPSLRRVVAALDRNLPLAEVRTLEDVVAKALADRRLAMALFGVFSVLSLVLAALGLYAVISYMVVQRRQEIGIRMALGAQARQILRLVLRQGLTLIAAGVIVGAIAALWLGRFPRRARLRSRHHRSHHLRRSCAPPRGDSAPGEHDPRPSRHPRRSGERAAERVERFRMREQPRWRRYLRFWGPDIAADVDDELRFHLEMRERDFLAAGLSPTAAREEALARFGDPDKVARWLRDHDTRKLRQSRRMEAMSQLLQDVRYGLRRLWKAPGFTLAVALVLALGIGATTAIFSVIDAALLRPLPYPEPERLVSVHDVQRQEEDPASYPEYLDWKQNTEVFADFGAYFTSSYALTGMGEPETLQAVRMSASVPRMLGVAPRVGRSFTPAEDVRGSERVVMISEDLWKRRFGGDPGVIGRTMTLEDNPYTVIGIIPHGHRSTLPIALAAARDFDLWVPLYLDTEHAPRGLHFMYVLGRLRPGLDHARAEERIAAFARRLQETGVTEHGIHIAPLERLVVGDSRALLFALAGAVGMVLLIACTNVANLLLVRSTVRRREIAIRAALGAGRGRLVRQLLVESLLLAFLGGSAGVLVAWAGVAGLRALGPATMPRLAEATVDARLLGFALALSLATGLLFGLLPALRASRADLSEVMKEGARGTAGGPARDRLRGTLIVAEVALSFALLIGAGLLLRSLDRLLQVDKGFDAGHVITGFLSLPSSRYPEGPQEAELFRELRERVKTLPGVQAVGFASSLPFEGGASGGLAIEGKEFPPDAQPSANKRIVTPGYFDALRTPVLAGRAFTEQDVAGAPTVIVINQAFAQRYFPGENPIGKRADFSWETDGMQEIVGVVADVREQALHEPAVPTIYIPIAQRPADWSYVIVRTQEDPLDLAPALRQAVASIDRNLPISEVRTMEDVVTEALAERRLAMALFGVFSGLSLALAALGLYGVISYMVVQRRQEIGIRMALGARTEQVVRSVLGQGLTLIVAGVIVGAVAALWLGRFLAGLVFGVGTTDPATFLSVALLLAATALLASMIPALRAAHVDPASVLRGE